MKGILLFLILIFSTTFISAGLDKYFHFLPLPNEMAEVQYKIFYASKELKWLMPLTGTAEFAAGILILFKKTRALGAVVIFPIMAGIVITNFFMISWILPVVLVLGFINLLIILINLKNYETLINPKNKDHNRTHLYN